MNAVAVLAARTAAAAALAAVLAAREHRPADAALLAAAGAVLVWALERGGWTAMCWVHPAASLRRAVAQWLQTVVQTPWVLLVVAVGVPVAVLLPLAWVIDFVEARGVDATRDAVVVIPAAALLGLIAGLVPGRLGLRRAWHHSAAIAVLAAMASVVARKHGAHDAQWVLLGAAVHLAADAVLGPGVVWARTRVSVTGGPIPWHAEAVFAAVSAAILAAAVFGPPRGPVSKWPPGQELYRRIAYVRSPAVYPGEPSRPAGLSPKASRRGSRRTCGRGPNGCRTSRGWSSGVSGGRASTGPAR